jgi:antitoxin VapB
VALNIKDGRADGLAREVAALTGETITEAVRGALAERLDRLRARRAAARLEPDLAALIQRGRSRAALDQRGADQIMGYDADGLPT